MQTFTFTQSDLRQLLDDTIKLFASKPNAYDFLGNAAQLVADEIMGQVSVAPVLSTGIDRKLGGVNIPFAGQPLPVDDTGNAEFDAAIEPAF